jgi:NAD(P)-dependent dehydrogenase (short-subunit alcohol dehydrogenase family)
MKELQGRLCLVTGGTRGIGRAAAYALADAGADVVFSYAQAKSQAQEVEQALREKGVRARGYQANVAVAGEVQAMMADVLQTLGPVSILDDTRHVG